MEAFMEKITRSKRFIRPSLDARGEFELLPNHTKVLEYLLFHRLLSSDQIERLTEYSSDYTRRLLEKLWKHEYVDRVKRVNKSDPFCYALGVQGVKILIRQKLYDGRNDFTDKNRNLTRDFVEHDLLTSEFMTRLALSCKKHNARLIYFPEILESAPERTRLLSRPYQWPVKVSFDGKSTTFMVNPDFHIFGIHYQNAPEGKNRTYLALETDMSTEPVFPADFTKRSNLFKKLLAYHETYRKKIYTTLYGIKNLRPLFIVRPRKYIQPNPEVRIQNIIQAAKRLNCERKLFLFATDKELESSDDLLTFGWKNHLDNESVRLLPSSLDAP